MQAMDVGAVHSNAEVMSQMHYLMAFAHVKPCVRMVGRGQQLVAPTRLPGGPIVRTPLSSSTHRSLNAILRHLQSHEWCQDVLDIRVVFNERCPRVRSQATSVPPRRKIR